MDFPTSHLRSFLAVCDLLSFSEAARRLSFSQSTVSQHVQRLEQMVQHRLLLRDTHSVTLTPDGEAMRDLAARAIAGHEAITHHFSGTAGRERLRVGISEDFAAEGLAALLSDFKRDSSGVDLEIAVGLSHALYEGYDAGELDVIFAKRCSGDRRGETVWQERLVWVGRPGLHVDPGAAVPLIAYAAPSVTRSMAINALDRAGRTWRMACSSGSLSGMRAAALAGLGVVAHSARLMPTGLRPLGEGGDLPLLDEVEFVALGPGKGHRSANALVRSLLRSGR